MEVNVVLTGYGRNEGGCCIVVDVGWIVEVF